MSMNTLVKRRGGKLRKRLIARVYYLLKSSDANGEGGVKGRMAGGGSGLALIRRRLRERGLV